MAGVITALQTQKKNKARVNVFLDNEYAFPLSLNAALSLKKGQFLSDEDIHRLKNQDEIDKAYQRALHFLSFRARTQYEIEKYLRDKDFSEIAIEGTTEKLYRHKYLDDVDFGQQWVSNRTRLKPKGRRALRYELRQKGLSDADIEKSIADLDEDDLAWQAVQKKLPLWQSLERMAFKKKLTAFLARRGFNYDSIASVLAKLETDN